MNQKIHKTYESIQKEQFCRNILRSTYIQHLQYIEISKSLSEIFSTSFDKEIANVSIGLYRLHKKLTLQMMNRNSSSHLEGETQR